MYGFQGATARKQHLADGGMVDKVLGAFGFGGPPETMTQKFAREDAARAAKAAVKAPAPTPAPAAAPTPQLGGVSMDAMKRREIAAGLKDGGPVPDDEEAYVPETGEIQGPGTGTSDSIDAEMRPGSVVLPADTTTAVKVSRGESTVSPETVQAIGQGVLELVNVATHTPVGENQAAGYGFSGAREKQESPNFRHGGKVPVPRYASGTGPGGVPTEDELKRRSGAADPNGAVFGFYPQMVDPQRTTYATDAKLRQGVQADAAGTSFVPAGTLATPGPQRLDNTTDPRSTQYADPGQRIGATAPLASAASASVPAAAPGPVPAPTPAPSPAPAVAPPPAAPWDQGREVVGGVRRIDGQSSPLFTNLPVGSADNAALMSRGQPGTPGTSQTLPSAVPAATTQANATSGNFGFQGSGPGSQADLAAKAKLAEDRAYLADNSFLYRQVAENYAPGSRANLAYLKMAANETAARTNATNQRETQETTRQNNAAQQAAEQTRLGFRGREVALDEAAKSDLLAAQRAYAAAKTPEERVRAEYTLRGIQGKYDREQPNRFTVVPGGTDDQGNKQASYVLNNQTGEFVNAPGAQAQRAVGTRSTVNGKTAVWDGKKWVPQ